MVASMPSDLQMSFHNEFTELADWEQAMVVAALERVAALLKADKIEAGPVLELGEIAPPQESL